MKDIRDSNQEISNIKFPRIEARVSSFRARGEERKEDVMSDMKGGKRTRWTEENEGRREVKKSEKECKEEEKECEKNETEGKTPAARKVESRLPYASEEQS